MLKHSPSLSSAWAGRFLRQVAPPALDNRPCWQQIDSDCGTIIITYYINHDATNAGGGSTTRGACTQNRVFPVKFSHEIPPRAKTKHGRQPRHTLNIHIVHS